MSSKESQLRRQVESYGGVSQPLEKFDQQQQIAILIQMLEQAKAHADENIQRLINETQDTLKSDDVATMKDAIVVTNNLVAQLENDDSAKPTVAFLKEKGLYRMLYRNAKFKGQYLDEDDILRKLLRNGFVGVGISALIVAGFVATMLLGGPFWLAAIASGLFVGASVYVSGLLYGVANDLFATHANLPYFLLGHQPQQTSMLRTNDKVAQGVAWGVAATFGPVVAATILFTVAATITAFFVPMATFLLPLMMIAMPLIAVGAEIYARKKAKEYAKRSYLDVGSNRYQWNGLDFMSPTVKERAAWHANSDRNMFGFTKVPLIGLVGLVAIITLSAVSTFLPALLFASPLLAVVIPAAFVAAAIVGLGALGLYTYINRNRHIDDRNNLEFDKEEVDYNLYLEQDKDYANSLLLEHQQSMQKGVVERPDESPREVVHHKPLFTSASVVTKRENENLQRERLLASAPVVIRKDEDLMPQEELTRSA
jgi:hypothetical protein